MSARRVVLGLAAGIAVAASAAGGRMAWHVSRHRPLVAQAAPDLQMSSLAAPLAVRNRIGLAVIRRMLWPETSVAESVEVTEERVGDRRVLVYRPAGAPDRAGALLWFHGGGYFAGRPEASHDVSSWLAAELGVVVVAAEYRLAPEHLFPAGLDDAQAALGWVHDHAAELGVDPERIAVGGASAGGGLAATLAQRAHDEGRVPVAFQLLVYPALDDRTVLSPLSRRPWLVWTPTSNRYAWTSYLGRRPGSAELPPYAAAARRDDLSGLPPAWIGVGDIDLLHDEDLEYARRLTAAGVECTVHVEPGMYHGADAGFGDTAETTRRFRSHLVAAARAGLADRP